MHRLAGFFVAFTLLSGSAFSPALAQDKTLTVFAAASMKNALDDVDAAYTAKTGVKISASYAASSVLAKQIEQGAPADVFVSADTDWMDYAIGKKTINEPTRVNLLGNSIVLVAPKPGGPSDAEVLHDFQALEPLTARKNNRIAVLRSDEAFANGPRILTLAEHLRQKLSELFPPPAPGLN